jgi:type VI secretion system secreted protein Hcp
MDNCMNAFIKIDGIPGESTDDQHKEWIEPTGFSFSVSQPTGGSRRDAGTVAGDTATFSDFQFVKRVDKASPKLFLECAKGNPKLRVTLQVHRATGKRDLYYEVLMENAMITNVSPSGSDSDKELPMESVSLSWGQMKIKYVHFDKDTKKGEIKAGWDAEKDKELS